MPGMLDVARNALVRVGILTVLAAIGGCAAPADRPAPQPDDRRLSAAEPSSAIDPCATNLEHISGALLLHLEWHGRFPATLDDLQPLPGGPALRFACPVTNQPYIFNPAGIHLVERSAYILVYDAQPAHDGRRWAIIMDEPAPDKALVMNVLPIPESLFLLHPPAGR